MNTPRHPGDAARRLRRLPPESAGELPRRRSSSWRTSCRRSRWRCRSRSQSPKLVVLDSMNLWIETAKPQLTEAMRRSEHRHDQRQEARQYAGTGSLLAAARAIMANGPSGVDHQEGRARRHPRLRARRLRRARPCCWKRSRTRPALATRSPAASWATWPRLAISRSPGSSARWSTARPSPRSPSSRLGVDRLARITRDDVQARYRELLEFTSFETIATLSA